MKSAVVNKPSFGEMFERFLVPTIFRPWADDLLDRMKPAARERVLDVACGTGIVGRVTRERCGTAARIAGVDVNPEMIAVARSVAPDIEWHEANALALPFTEGSFDTVLCQQGLQFFPDRPVAAREMRRMLGARGRVAMSTWRPLEENPLFLALHRLAANRFGPHVDRRFSYGDADAISTLLADAGFREIRTETVTRTERFTDPATFVALNLGATVSSLEEMGAAEREQVVTEFQADAQAVIAPFRDGNALVHPVRANVVMAVA